MTTTVVLAVVAGAGLAAGLAAYLWLRPALRDASDVIARCLARLEQPAADLLEPSKVVRDLFREVVVVTLKTGETFRGVLVAADPHALLLREAMALAERDAVGIDGELIVPRSDVAYIQRP